MADALTPSGLDLRAISPAASAKYSPNLYKWLTMPRHKPLKQPARHRALGLVSGLWRKSVKAVLT